MDLELWHSRQADIFQFRDKITFVHKNEDGEVKLKVAVRPDNFGLSIEVNNEARLTLDIFSGTGDTLVDPTLFVFDNHNKPLFTIHLKPNGKAVLSPYKENP